MERNEGREIDIVLGYFKAGCSTMVNKQVRQTLDIMAPIKTRAPGRPPAIPSQLESTVADIYRRGDGYCAIARILRDAFGVNPDFTTVRRLLKKLRLIVVPVNR